jgi:hypothetical protein
MKAYTDGQKVYKVGSLGANCWKQIEMIRLSDWQKKEYCYWIVTSQHAIAKILGETSWFDNESAQKALDACAGKMGWKEI